MSESVMGLLSQGLIITALGMGLVFLGLGLLWGLIILLTRLLGPAPEGAPAPGQVESPAPADIAEDALTAERARVAALVAGAFLANALPIMFEAPTGPAFEHGRTAPLWVTSNRARVLQSWQPARRGESGVENPYL